MASKIVWTPPHLRSKFQAPLRPVESTTARFKEKDIPRSPCANASIVMLRHEYAPNKSASWGWDWHPDWPVPSDSFNFGLPLPMDSTNPGKGLISGWTTSLKRSFNKL